MLMSRVLYVLVSGSESGSNSLWFDVLDWEMGDGQGFFWNSRMHVI
jgi:hypothetical protein